MIRVGSHYSKWPPSTTDGYVMVNKLYCIIGHGNHHLNDAHKSLNIFKMAVMSVIVNGTSTQLFNSLSVKSFIFCDTEFDFETFQETLQHFPSQSLTLSEAAFLCISHPCDSRRQGHSRTSLHPALLQSG